MLAELFKMVRVIKLKDIKEKEIIKAVKDGKIFVYPTDTIYGLGCNALNEKSVEKIREVKRRSENPFSVIAPNKAWIYRNFEVKKSYIQRLPGPFTFILKIKIKKIVAENVAPGLEVLGVRIPDHKFTKILQKAKVPFITTSVNISGEKHVTDINKLSKKILKKVDFVIDDGVLNKKASVVIDLSGKIAKILRR